MRSTSPQRHTVGQLLALAALTLAACAPAGTPTPIPATETPAATATRSQTRTPRPTQTPMPTYTPRPTQTRRPTATPTPLPEPMVFTGTGDQVVDLDWDGSALLHITYTGSGNFAVWSYDDNGEVIDLLVNTIGRYDGIRPLDFSSADDTTRLVIESSGEWTIQVSPLDMMRGVELPATFSGTGDDVVYLIAPGRPDLLTIDASTATGNFAVWASSEHRDLLVNEIAPYTGTVMIPRDIPGSRHWVVLTIEAEGKWTIKATSK